MSKGQTDTAILCPGQGLLVLCVSPWSSRALGDLLGADWEYHAPCRALHCSPPEHRMPQDSALPLWAASCHLLVLNATYKANSLLSLICSNCSVG